MLDGLFAVRAARYSQTLPAEVAELADAEDSKSSARKGLGVRFPSSALATSCERRRVPVLAPGGDATVAHLGDAHAAPFDLPAAAAPLDRDAPLRQHDVTPHGQMLEVETHAARRRKRAAHQLGERV